MTQYPDTEAYMINYPGGTYGSFITGIVLMLLGIIPKNKKIIFSTYGNAHDLSSYVTTNYKRTDVSIVVDQMYELVEPIDPQAPLVMKSHMFPDWDKMFYYYPKCKNIIITRIQEDLLRASGNLFFKNIIEEYYNEKNIHGKYSWYTLKSRNTEYFKKNNINSPDDLTPATTQELISRMVSNKQSPFDHLNSSVRENVFYIQMSDIIRNKNKVLLFLKHITGREVTPQIIETYDQYLKAQDVLVKTKMPWVEI